MDRRRRIHSSAGFTLVEMAIVLVIIGLLLGGVLKGQELINSAKVKNYVNDFKSIPLFIYAYQDRFRVLPGDDPDPVGHLGASATLSPSSGTRGNGLIEGNFNSTGTSDESLAFWQQIRLANLANGSTDFSSATAIAAAIPRNTDGGRIGVQSASPITGLTGVFFLCSDMILGKFVRQIDLALDDGNSAAGSIRAMVTGYSGTPLAAVAPTGLDNNTPYTVCAAF